MSLQIQCPSCSRRFEIPDGLEGRLVECGSCDHRFKVEEECFVKERKKHYPGENRSQFLDRLGKTPAPLDRNTRPVSFQAAQYQSTASPESVMPSSSGQQASLAAGFVLFILLGLLFFLGSNSGGFLQDVDLARRLLLGGFLGLVASALLVMGAKNWRLGAFVLSLFLLGGLGTLIYLRPIHQTPGQKSQHPGWSIGDDDPRPQKTPVTRIDTLKERVGYNRIEEELAASDDPDQVLAIYARPFEARFKPVLENYFSHRFRLRMGQVPSTYTREDGRGLLMIFSGLDLSMDEILDIVQVLGDVREHLSLRLLELDLSMRHFQEIGTSRYQELSDPEHPNFSAANLAELRHIDIVRAKKAVERIDILPDEIQLSYKPQVITELVRLLRNYDDPELQSSIGNALQTWDGLDEKTVSRVAAILKDRVKEDLPTSLVDYLITGKSADAHFIIDMLWASNPLKWADRYEQIGVAGEDRLLYHLAKSPARLQKSAVEILQRVGSAKSLPALKKAKGTRDKDFDRTLENAIRQILKRRS